MNCRHKWQHYGINYLDYRFDEYSQQHLDSYIEHFRACIRCGRIEKRDYMNKEWTEA